MKKTFKKRRIPKRLQGVLWSVDVKDLDLERSKAYIIHQIFGYGTMEEILWVFRTYAKKDIIKTFMTKPYKDYIGGRFYFVKNYLLHLNHWHPDIRYYVRNTPRVLR